MRNMHLDLYSRAALIDPYPLYETLRREAACYYDATRRVYLVSRHADVMAVLRDPGRFSSREGAGYHRVDDPERGGILVSTDPPRHTAIRRLVQQAFTARVAALEERIGALAGQLVERAIARGRFDVVRDVAEPLPVAITSELLGLETEPLAEFAGWSDAVFRTMGPMSEEEALVAGASIEALVDHLMPLVVERRYVPGSLTETILSGVSSGALTFGEAFSLLLSVFSAGIDTTVNAIGNGLAALASRPDALRALRQRPELVDSAVEEMLRFDAPIQAFFRTAVAPSVVAGVTIPAGARVMALFGSANRDPDRYEAPETFDVARNPTDQLAFGAGIHLCLGAPLARREMRAVVRALTARARELAPAGSATRRERAVVRGFASLPVEAVAAT